MPGPEIIAQNCITSKAKSSETLPSHIPHNEAILIPNHYTARASSSHEFSKDEINEFEGQILSKDQDKFVTKKGSSSLVIQNSSCISKRLRRNEICLKPPPPPSRSELPNFTKEINQKIEMDRESQIAWSEEDSVHTDWSESNVWSDEDDDGIMKGNYIDSNSTYNTENIISCS